MVDLNEAVKQAGIAAAKEHMTDTYRSIGDMLADLTNIPTLLTDGQWRSLVREMARLIGELGTTHPTQAEVRLRLEHAIRRGGP